MPVASKRTKARETAKTNSRRDTKALPKTEHSPTLTTIRMVEGVLKNMPGSDMKISELKRALPRKVNHNTLMAVIDYLDECNRIYVGRKGITWLVNDSPKFRKALKNAISYDEMRRRLSGYF